MTRFAAAAMTFALAGAAHAAPRAKPVPTGPVTVVRAVALSATAQTGHAYAATDDAKYVTEFPHVFEVGVVPPAPKGRDRRVVFTCITLHCKFVATENQPYEGNKMDRIDETSYKVLVIDGKASIRLSIEGLEHDAPAQTYVVSAEPTRGKGEPPILPVPVFFTLTSR